MSMVVTRAALTARVGFLVSMVNIKVRLKNGKSEKGAIMKQTPTIKKIKVLLYLQEKPFLETQRKRWSLGLLAMPSPTI
jgi:hypothetical protein